MRRRTQNREIPPRRARLARRAAIMLLLCWLAWYTAERAEDAMWPALREVAQHECRTLVTKCLNDAVCAALAADPALCADLYTADGAAVRGDAARINAARAALVGAAQQALDTMPQNSITVPLGSLSGSLYLFDLGPGWTVHLSPVGYVEGEVEEQTEAVGINRTRFTAELVLRAAVNVLLDGRAALTQTEQRVLLASFVLDGAVPNYYRAGG